MSESVIRLFQRAYLFSRMRGRTRQCLSVRLSHADAPGVCRLERWHEGQAGRHDHAQLPTRRFHALGRAQERPGLLREPYWEWAIDDLVDVRRRSSSQPSSIYYRDPQSLNNHEMTGISHTLSNYF